MFHFLLGFFLGSKHNTTAQLKPAQETLDRHTRVLKYVRLHPVSTCSEIASALNLFCPDVNASLIKLERSGMVRRDENKRYVAV